MYTLELLRHLSTQKKKSLKDDLSRESSASDDAGKERRKMDTDPMVTESAPFFNGTA